MFTIKNNLSTLTPEGILPTLRECEFFQNKNNKTIERVLVFCTILYIHYYYYKDKIDSSKKNKANPFQQISTELIITILTRDNYVEIIEQLKLCGIIEVNNSYSAGCFPKSYRISDKFFQQRALARRIENKQVQKSVYQMNDLFVSTCLDNYPYLLPLYHNLEKIYIDSNEAIKCIENNKDTLSENSYKNYYRHILKIRCGWMRKMSVSDTNHRLHSTFTSFPKDLRQFLCVVDKESGELNCNHCIIDGSNTQPLMICVRMEQEGHTVDEDFKSYCTNGKLYDIIAMELEKSKRWVKDMMLTTILFTPTNSEYTHKHKNPSVKNGDKQMMSKYFKKRFPLVYQWLFKVKDDLRNSGQQTKNFRNKGGSLLAYKIQKMEAGLWIHHLLKEIPSEYTFVTIHDAVMLFNYTEEQVQFIENKIKEIGMKLYGIEIPLNRKYSNSRTFPTGE